MTRTSPTRSETGAWDRPNASDYAAAWANVWRVIA